MNQLRLGLALAGFTAALLGVAFGDRRVTWLAIGLLGISLVLRLILRKRQDHSSGTDHSL